MSGPSERGWEAVEHAEQRLQERAAARLRTDARRRRHRTWVAWILRIALPVAGAAAVLATVGSLHRWPSSTGALVLGAELLVPALVVGLTARHDSALEVVLWALVALAAEVALVFGVGFALLGLGPR